MTLAIRTGGASKNVTGIAIRKGGALKTVTEAWIRTGGALKQFYSVLQITLSASAVLGRGNSAATLPVTSAPVTATAAGTIGAVTYAWTRTDAGAQPWTIDAPTSATTTFTTSCAQGDDFTATFICTVSDQSGQSLASSAVAAECANIYFGGGYLGDSPPPPGTAYP